MTAPQNHTAILWKNVWKSRSEEETTVDSERKKKVVTDVIRSNS